MTGTELITRKRQEQFTKRGITVEMDVKYNKAMELAEAASVLAHPFGSVKKRFSHMPEDWNNEGALKMCSKPYKERLIIAGALIAAEIDRLIYEEDNIEF